MVQIGTGYKKTKEIYVREEQKGSAGRQSNRNPSPVVGANGSRTGSNREDGFNPSMSKIAGTYGMRSSALLHIKESLI